MSQPTFTHPHPSHLPLPCLGLLPSLMSLPPALPPSPWPASPPGVAQVHKPLCAHVSLGSYAEHRPTPAPASSSISTMGPEKQAKPKISNVHPKANPSSDRHCTAPHMSTRVRCRSPFAHVLHLMHRTPIGESVNPGGVKRKCRAPSSADAVAAK